MQNPNSGLNQVLYISTSFKIFVAEFCSKFVTFLLFLLFSTKTLKMTILTSIWGAQHPNPGRNKQQLTILCLVIFWTVLLEFRKANEKSSISVIIPFRESDKSKRKFALRREKEIEQEEEREQEWGMFWTNWVTLIVKLFRFQQIGSHW